MLPTFSKSIFYATHQGISTGALARRIIHFSSCKPISTSLTPTAQIKLGRHWASSSSSSSSSSAQPRRLSLRHGNYEGNNPILAAASRRHRLDFIPRRDIVISSRFPDIDIPGDDFFSFIKAGFLRHPEDELFVDGVTSRVWTAGAVVEAAEKTASALAKQGFTRGDVACLFSVNNPEFIVVCLAVLALGGVVTPANTAFLSAEVTQQIHAANAKLLFCSHNLLATAEAAFHECRKEGPSLERLIVIDGDGSTDIPASCPSISLTSLMGDDGKAFSGPPAIDAANDVAFLPYSSGTTGLPKGVMLTHRNMVANQLQCLNPIFDTTEIGDSVLGLLPFYHIYGLSAIVFSFPLRRNRVVTLPAFDPVAFLSAIQKHKMTMLHLVPPLVIFLAKHPLVVQFDISSVKAILSAAAPLSKDTEAAFSARTGVVDIRQAYGLSETSPMISMSPKGGAEVVRPGSAGIFPANTQLKVIDLTSGEELGEEAVGEICCRGPQIMKGYLNNEKATSQCLDPVDGWFQTGDIGYVSADGYLYITDRLKELIKYKGHQVAPAQLEALLLAHDAVADAAVIGVAAAEDVGELPKAFVVLKPGVEGVAEADLRLFVDNQVSPHSKLRGGVEFIEAIPKSAAGKILRRMLRDRN